MRKLEKLANTMNCIDRGNMEKVMGGIAIAEETLDYCWEIETTDPTDANWNCSDAVTRSLIDGVRQRDMWFYEQP